MLKITEMITMNYILVTPQDTLAAWEALLGHSERWGEEWQMSVALNVAPLHNLPGAVTFTLSPSRPPTLLSHKVSLNENVHINYFGMCCTVTV